jgi:hypothetical protein
MKRSATAAIAAFLSRLGIERAPSFVVQVILRQAAKTATSAQNPAVPSGGPSKPVRSHGNPMAGKVAVHLRFDATLLAKADAAAKRQGITRTGWLHRAAFDALNEFGSAVERPLHPLTSCEAKTHQTD